MGTPNVSADQSAGPAVVYDVTDGVGTIRLNRPEAMNSLDIPTKELLRDTVVEAAADPAVRCVVLTGTGRAFCTGQDLKEHIRLLQEGRDDSLSSTVELHYNPTVTAIASMEKPVVAAVNGVAAGAGMSLALACDFRVTADTAGFNSSFSGVGLSCDTGSSYTLQRVVGRAAALDLLYFPRTVKADEALSLGLATQVVPADELDTVVGELAARLASGPTVSYGSIRRSVAYAASHTFEEALVLEGEMMARTGATEDHRNAVASFVAKEKPTFNGR